MDHEGIMKDLEHLATKGRLPDKVNLMEDKTKELATSASSVRADKAALDMAAKKGDPFFGMSKQEKQPGKTSLPEKEDDRPMPERLERLNDSVLRVRAEQLALQNALDMDNPFHDMDASAAYRELKAVEEARAKAAAAAEKGKAAAPHKKHRPETEPPQLSA